MDTTKLLEARATALEEMNKAVETLGEADTDEKRAEARAAFDSAEAEVDRIDGNLKAAKRAAELATPPALPATTTTTTATVVDAVVRSEVKVGKEPLTYQRNGPNSFVGDMIRATMPGSNDLEAASRLQRHIQEMEVERRDMTTTDSTSIGQMIPPLWAVDMYAPVARAGKPLALAIGSRDLPRGTDVIIIPRVTTGGSVHFQVTQNSAVAEQDMVTGEVGGTVSTIAGQLDLSLQSVDWGAINMIDQFALPELFSLHANRLETAVGQGTGANGQFLGIIGTSGTQTVTYSSATPTAGSLYSKVADGVQQIHTNRFMPPDLIVMHPRRWAFLLAASDTTGRPLVVPQAQGPWNASAEFGGTASEGVVGTMQGLPVLVSSAAIPTNDSAGTTNDVVLVTRRQDLMLWESPLRSRVLYEVLSGTLTVRVQVYNYSAFIAGRYATATSAVRGTGLATPSF